MTEQQHLTDDERAQLAREVATDGYRYEDEIDVTCEECGEPASMWIADDVVRNAVKYGWDAALEWIRQREQELILKP